MLLLTTDMSVFRKLEWVETIDKGGLLRRTVFKAPYNLDNNNLGWAGGIGNTPIF